MIEKKTLVKAAALGVVLATAVALVPGIASARPHHHHWHHHHRVIRHHHHR